jgi:hypothetical protein
LSITLEFRPEVERQLAVQAKARGLSVEEYLRNLVELQVGPPVMTFASDEEWERSFEKLIDGFPQQPVLSDAAIGRDSIYTREDEL